MVTITALNGRLPDAVLVVVDTGPNGPQRLRADAAASWARMLASGMPAGHLRSGYRTLADQENDHATKVMLQWFITEQVEEEASTKQAVDRLKLAGTDSSALLVREGRI